MPSAHLAILEATFLGTDDSHWIGAIAPLLLAFALAQLVDLAFRRRGRQIAQTVRRGALSRETDTRLRFVRRLTYTSILLIGFAVALSQFRGVDRVAASVLASGAIAAAVIGFAAQRTLANFVAGVMLAVTQPVRIGDWVTFEDHHGVVEDVRLNFTVLRTASDQRIIIPNERLASGVLVNDTLAVDVVGLDVSLWLPLSADTDRALEVLEEETGVAASIAEVTSDGVRLAVGGERVAPAEKGAHEAELRARCLRRLRDQGVLEGAPTIERS
jgi:small-conductance mechanosensitive channel